MLKTYRKEKGKIRKETELVAKEKEEDLQRGEKHIRGKIKKSERENDRGRERARDRGRG